MSGYKKSEETKQKIMQATIGLLEANGYEGTTIRDICAVSGVSLSRLNYHFGSKDLLMLEIAKIIPILIDKELARHYSRIEGKTSIAYDLAFTILLLKILYTEGDSIKVYRNIYTRSFVKEHVIDSTRLNFMDHYNESNRPVTKAMLIVLASGYANAIYSLIEESVFDAMQKQEQNAIEALCDFYMLLLNVPLYSQKDIIFEAQEMVKKIGFKITGITTVEFFELADND